jgi:hypothetical protein
MQGWVIACRRSLGQWVPCVFPLPETRGRSRLQRRGAEETEATVKEIRRKATKVAPAYNKEALQYLPNGKD